MTLRHHRRGGPPGNTDDTVRLVPPRRPPARWPWWVAAGVAAAGCALAAFVVLEPAPPGPTPVASVTAPPAAAPLQVPAPPPAIVPISATQPAALPLETEADILARQPDRREVYRFALQPEVVVIQFPGLGEQGRMLNRMAGLIEKAGFPRDRVLNDAELDRRIRAGGDTPETFYLGHDYRAADVLRFFVTAERDGVTLTAEETWLRETLKAWEWRPGATGALITLTRTLPEAGVDAAARATILRHELSHGAYFTRPDYNAYAHKFWSTELTPGEQASFRAFLGIEGYDTSIDDLMINETQAYLMHTADARFFQGSRAGLSPDRLETLRILFLTGMPTNWLRDCTTVPPRTR